MFDGDGWWMMIFPIMGLVFIALMISGMWGFWGRGPRRRRWSSV